MYSKLEVTLALMWLREKAEVNFSTTSKVNYSLPMVGLESPTRRFPPIEAFEDPVIEEISQGKTARVGAFTFEQFLRVYTLAADLPLQGVSPLLLRAKHLSQEGSFDSLKDAFLLILWAHIEKDTYEEDWAWKETSELFSMFKQELFGLMIKNHLQEVSALMHKSLGAGLLEGCQSYYDPPVETEEVTLPVGSVIAVCLTGMNATVDNDLSAHLLRDYLKEISLNDEIYPMTIFKAEAIGSPKLLLIPGTYEVLTDPNEVTPEFIGTVKTLSKHFRDDEETAPIADKFKYYRTILKRAVKSARSL